MVRIFKVFTQFLRGLADVGRLPDFSLILSAFFYAELHHSTCPDNHHNNLFQVSTTI